MITITLFIIIIMLYCIAAGIECKGFARNREIKQNRKHRWFDENWIFFPFQIHSYLAADPVGLCQTDVTFQFGNPLLNVEYKKMKYEIIY